MFPLPHGQLIHFIFEAVAIFSGFRWYLHLRKGDPHLGQEQAPRFDLLVGCLLGAAIGNKLLFWVEYPHLLATAGQGLGLLFAGQSIVGGLLGGLLGIELAKLATGYRHSTGDRFVFPLLLGIFIGRIGCFLAGLADGTFGTATPLPWGIDFGDGIPRHPTQLYEMAFILLLGLVLARYRQRWAVQSGLLFKVMLSAYLVWRVAIDFLKPLPYAYPGGLSGIQLFSLAALTLYLPLTWRQARGLQRVAQE